MRRVQLKGVLFTDPFSYQNPSEVVQKFRKAFKEKYSVEPSSYGALAYDSVFVLEKVLSKLSWPIKKENLPKMIRDQMAKNSGCDRSHGHDLF